VVREIIDAKQTSHEYREKLKLRQVGLIEIEKLCSAMDFKQCE
jgi:hypothetical protein